MGFFDVFKNAEARQTAAASYISASNLLSPNSSANLAMVLFPDVDESQLPVTVAQAVTVPAVARAIQIYAATAQTFELTATSEQPWLTSTEGAITPALRTVLTQQDLIFFNESLWLCSRNDAGFVQDALHVHRDRWTYDATGEIKVDGNKVNQDELIYFRGLLPSGFLEAGRASVRHALNIANTINNRSAVPEPVTLINQTSAEELEDEEIDEIVDNLANSMKNKRGGIVHVPYGYDVTGYGASDSNNTMLIAARMSVRTDIANHLGINAAMLDGSTGSNEVYSNALQSQSELLSLSIRTFTDPIAARLSQNDVTPEGTTVNFSYSSFDIATDARGNIGTSTPEDINND